MTGAACGVARWLCLAATPGFAIMALVTSALRGSQMSMLGSAAPHTSPLTGMVTMYVLMSLFHSAPRFELATPSRRAGQVAETSSTSRR